MRRPNKDQPTLFPEDPKPNAYQEKPEIYVRACNRCNKVRDMKVGVCPDCGCPEFRLMRPQ